MLEEKKKFSDLSERKNLWKFVPNHLRKMKNTRMTFFSKYRRILFALATFRTSEWSIRDPLWNNKNRTESIPRIFSGTEV
jgi:hypothetical protein